MLLPTMDNVLYNVQRQGKISFYVRVHHDILCFTNIRP